MSRKSLKENLSDFIKTEREILNIKFSESYYSSIESKTKLEILEYLAELCIINNTYTCVCGRNMELIVKSKVDDGHVWHCKLCRKEKTCRYNSVFEGFKTSLLTIFKAIHKFCKNDLQADMTEALELDKNTVSKWCLFLREIIQDHFLQHPVVLGGLDQNGNKKNNRDR